MRSASAYFIFNELRLVSWVIVVYPKHVTCFFIFQGNLVSMVSPIFFLPATQRCFLIPLFVLCHEGLKSFFYIGRTKQGLHDRLTEQFKALAKNDNSSAIADRVDTNGPNTD